MNMRVRYKRICCGDGPGTNKLESHKDLLRGRYPILGIVLFVILFTSLYLSGILSYLFEDNFSKYSFPIDIKNAGRIIESIDRLEYTQNLRDPIFGASKVDYDTIMSALYVVQAEDIHGNKVTPLTQFIDLDYPIDIKPTCNQQWGAAQLNETQSLVVSNRQTSLITVILIVKSAVNNYARRHAIRRSWYLNETLNSIFAFKTVFIVGKCHERNFIPTSTTRLSSAGAWSANDCDKKIQWEASTYGDIVQSSGIDSYYNNTIKTYMTYRWINERCPSDFVLTIDDDYVFEVENFMDYMLKLGLENKSSQADNTDSELPRSDTNKSGQHSMISVVKEVVETRSLGINNGTLNIETREQSNSKSLVALKRLSKQHLYAGYLRNYVHPLRSVLSKWYITQKEYPYNKYPPYITGGAVLMSFKTIKHLYYATYFTQSFKFDDVYVGMLAYKLGLTAKHSDEFFCSIDNYLAAHPIRANSTTCICVHEIEPDQLVELWQTRRRMAQTEDISMGQSTTKPVGV